MKYRLRDIHASLKLTSIGREGERERDTRVFHASHVMENSGVQIRRLLKREDETRWTVLHSPLVISFRQLGYRFQRRASDRKTLGWLAGESWREFGGKRVRIRAILYHRESLNRHRSTYSRKDRFLGFVISIYRHRHHRREKRTASSPSISESLCNHRN